MNLEEFYIQLQKMKGLGVPLKKILRMLPGQLGQMADEVDEGELTSAESILAAMTPEERKNPDLLLDEPRRVRISESSGQPLREVNLLLAQFAEARKFLERDS